MHPFKKQYDFYYNRSPWHNEMQEENVLELQYKIQLLLRKMPSFIKIPFALAMQRLLILVKYRC